MDLWQISCKLWHFTYPTDREFIGENVCHDAKERPTPIIHVIIHRCRVCGATGCDNEECPSTIYATSNQQEYGFKKIWTGSKCIDKYVCLGKYKRCGSYNSFEWD